MVLAQFLWVKHVFCALPRSEHSGDQVLGKHTVPGGLCILVTSPLLAFQFPGCATRAESQVCHVFSGGSSQALTLLADVNCPGS